MNWMLEHREELNDLTHATVAARAGAALGFTISEHSVGHRWEALSEHPRYATKVHQALVKNGHNLLRAENARLRGELDHFRRLLKSPM